MPSENRRTRLSGSAARTPLRSATLTEIAAELAYGASFEDLVAPLKRPEPGGYPVHKVRKTSNSIGIVLLTMHPATTSPSAPLQCLVSDIKGAMVEHGLEY
jgi:hypothetical protein